MGTERKRAASDTTLGRKAFSKMVRRLSVSRIQAFSVSFVMSMATHSRLCVVVTGE
ncbi:hypothetical protein AN958_11346 [Leucoagaricus sp. SymC.cos]|nr:hypothetical protein AN958_11346 [Leucoagaricus sp. SymC.cos]